MLVDNKKKFKKRKPSIFIVCEGKNKTERHYFKHFNERQAPYILHIVDSERTDILNMVKKANDIYSKYSLDSSIGDQVFCLIDLDLDIQKYHTYIKVKAKYKKIRIIISNPCFEVWLLYYFTKHPKRVESSQKLKLEMRKYLHDYKENMDVYNEVKLDIIKHRIAIQNSQTKNKQYDTTLKEVDRNPYTEVSLLVEELIKYHNLKINGYN